MPCTTATFVDYTTEPVTYSSRTVCWVDDGDDDTYRPPSGTGSESGIDSGGPVTPPNFNVDPNGGTIVVPDTSTPDAPIIDLNPGWNSGAFSIGSLAPDWGGTVSFDVPDVDGARPAGVAVGFCPVDALPTTFRNGYDHLRYGLVFTEDSVAVIHDGVEALVEDYATINAARTTTGTDLVQALLYGDLIRWVVNGINLFGGPFSIPTNYALDAVLYLAYDKVDNPQFAEGEWPDEDGSLIGTLPRIEGAVEGLADGDLACDLPALFGKLSDAAYAEMTSVLGALYGSLGVGDGVQGNLGRLIGRMAEPSSYTTVEGLLGGVTGALAGGSAAAVKFSALTGFLPRMVGSMAGPATGTIDSNLPNLFGRINAEATFSELVGALPGLRGNAYGGGLTPLVQVMERVGYVATTYPRAYLTITATEFVRATATATVDATLTNEALESITAQDSASVFATMLEAVAERIGLGERVSTLVFRIATGGLVDEGEAWVVNTASSASARYDSYGFNSFFALAGKHYGVRQDGVYLLEGANDAGVPITAGVSLGKHDFGTQALKQMNAVYVGVSSTGKMLLRVGDGKNTYTYMARDASPTLEAQRFDVGRGLRSNYFTFDLVSEGDAFELDSPP